MAQEDRFSRLAGKVVRRSWREASPSLLAPPQHLIGSVERALRGRKRRRQAIRWGAALGGGGVAVVALVLALAPPGARRAPPSVMSAAPDGVAAAPAPKVAPERVLAVVGDGAPQSIAAGMRWIAPPTSRVRLASTAGTRVTLEPGGSMAAMDASATQRLALMRGTVDVHVAKLLTGERFVIDTPDVEVEVHGTSFQVALVAEGAERCDEDTTTRVSVTEGVVSVRWGGVDARLLPGDSWPANCRPVVAAAAPTTADRAPRRLRAKLRGRARAAARSGVTTPVRVSASGDSPGDGRSSGAAPTSTEASSRQRASEDVDASALTAQNDLYASAVRAKRAGRGAEASRLFADFIRRFPDSSLLESAMAQRMRLAAAARDATVASARAREYLARFPSGFARDEARTLLGR